MNFPVISLIAGDRPNLIELVIVLSHLFLENDVKMGNDTYISLAFLLLSKKIHLFCQLQLFSQNTHVPHFLEVIFSYAKRLKTDIVTCRYQKKNVICSKLTIKAPHRREWRCSCIFVVNFE